MPPTEVLQHEISSIATQIDGQAITESERRPGQPWDRLRPLGQPRHSTELRLPILLTPFGNQLVGVLMCHDHLGIER